MDSIHSNKDTDDTDEADDEQLLEDLQLIHLYRVL
jgi:hypothetical protein